MKQKWSHTEWGVTPVVLFSLYIFKYIYSKIAQESEIEPYKKMGLYMAEHQEEVLVEDNAAGLEKARQGGFAMVLESATAEYAVNQDCSLIIIGDPFRQTSNSN